MRRPMLALSLCLAAGALAPQASAGEQIHQIVYVSADLDEYQGELRVVQSDGANDRMLVDDRVMRADVGPEGRVLFIVEVPGESPDDPATGELLETSLQGEDTPEPVGEDVSGAFYLGVAISPQSRVAFGRQVTSAPEPAPEYLAPAIDDLKDAVVPILVPPEEPPRTGGVVASSSEDGYSLLFTNDPEGELSHAEQVNRSVEAQTEPHEGPDPGLFSQEVMVRGQPGTFYCGASVCRLTWRENEATYTIAEFGDPDEARAFARALVPIEDVAGPSWRDPTPFPAPELLVLDDDGETTTLEKVKGFCECGFTPVSWNPNGRRVLVIGNAEGYSTLMNYRADGSGRPRTLTEGSELEGAAIVDAAYGPGGVWMLLTGEGGPPGILRSLDAETSIENVRAFDIAGSTLAYVTGDGELRVRDLESGEERTVTDGAIEVSISPEPLAAERPAPLPPPQEDFPWLPVILAAAGVVALGLGTWMIRRARRRRA